MPSRKKNGLKMLCGRPLGKLQINNVSIRKAAEMFIIPKSTLADRVSGRIDVDAEDGKKKKQCLRKRMREKLSEYAEKRASLGIGFGKKTYLRYAGQLTQKKGINFKNKIPSDKWWRLHKKRFPDTLSLRKPEATAAIRHKQMNPENVGSYFDALKETLLKHQLMNSPEKIWNIDETYLPLSVDSEKVLTPLNLYSSIYIL
ncbi:unnamed protein product [Mytilus edulis]|uniref:HTH psq-type domain-containing protein n=1 Tax=Mytilus edulis TaxID=6550 RepID=A0A8S3UK35_MYTED|nr:unnamed protein product [Mytilus edulis]